MFGQSVVVKSMGNTIEADSGVHLSSGAFGCQADRIGIKRSRIQLHFPDSTLKCSIPCQRKRILKMECGCRRFVHPLFEKSHFEVTMNGTLRLSILLSFIVCLTACAQDVSKGQPPSPTPKQQTSPPSEQHTSRMPEWKHLRDGVDIIRMWDTALDLQFPAPQIAILRFSSKDEHDTFERDPKKYLMDNHVFGNDPSTDKPYQLKKIISRVDLTEDELQRKEVQTKSQRKGSDPWYVVAEHNAYCDSAIIEASVD